MTKHHIAIIGMGCRYPGAANVAEFWNQVRDGRSAIREVPASRWDVNRYFDMHPRAVDKTYSKHMAAVDDLKSFAPEFYNITPKRAKVMDPQQRMLLDCARVALEDAGYATRALPKETTGVYTGVSVSEHKDIITARVHATQLLDGMLGSKLNVSDDVRDQLISRIPALHAYSMVGQLLNMNAANISQVFDFGGPVFSVDTACSSALVALHEAVLHLRCGITDAALVGGAFASLDSVTYVTFSRIGALSRAGACMPFEQRADGFVLGEGAGVVVLKRLEDARRDGDRVLAVIDGLAVNNDARGEGPMTPSRKGQLTALRRAYRDANVSPATVGMIEAHGTATAAGDAAEVAALTDLFADVAEARGSVALGSVKANVGHGMASSGMASLIKGVLAVNNAVLPMQALFESERADLNLAGAGLEVLRESKPWTSDVRRAGVSSFGFGGTNAHVVVSNDREERRMMVAAPKPYRLTFSAPNATLLAAYVGELRAAFKALPANVTVADVAYTAALRRVDTVRVQVEATTFAELDRELANAVVCYGDVKPVAADAFDKDCRVVTLPASPLATREMWAIEEEKEEAAKEKVMVSVELANAQREVEVDRLADLMNEVVAKPTVTIVPTARKTFNFKKVSQPVVEPVAPVELVEPVEPVDTREVEPVVLAAIARVSAYPLTHLKLEQSLPNDLGFDSLMSADLVGELVAAYPGLGDGTDLLKKELTIGGLCEAIALKLANSTPVVAAPAASMHEAPVMTSVVSELSLETHAWLADHTVNGKVLVPLAFVTDAVVDVLHQVVKVPMAIVDLKIVNGVRLVDGKVAMKVDFEPDTLDVTVSSAADRNGAWTKCYEMRVKKVETAAAELLTIDSLEATPLSMDEFYRDFAFHGPSLRALVDEPRVGTRSVSGLVRSSMTSPASKQVSVLAFDGALQVAAYWAATRVGAIALPTAVAEIRVLKPMGDEPLYCAAVVEQNAGQAMVAHLDVLNGAGEPVLQVRGLQGRLLKSAKVQAKPAVPEASYRIEAFPEVAALQARKQAMAAANMKMPYFTLHEATARDTSVVNGREVVSFSTYNYLGLSGEAEVNQAAKDAVEQYGTSVSASRVAAGERPVHRELEAAIARFLGVEDSIVFVGGHATNVTTIGHIVGPQDLILHDALSHDSIVGGAKLSGARHRSFAHNDMAALEKLLKDLRPSARRVLIVVEGVYSMDGDICPLDKLIELKKQYGALLLVDEAHSLGVLGATGRGVGEHFGVNPADVDMWMGTLSKSLASCGGYIAGSKALVEYLKFTAPGFVYSVGLPAASAAAAKAAIEMIEQHPERVTTLRARADYFRALCNERGVDTGMSQGSAVVPCIVGDSVACLKVAAELNAQGVSVHPIVYPAVEEHLARLRFFVSALHSEEQLLDAADKLQSVLAANTVPAQVAVKA